MDGEAKCIYCGRKLTDPESLERGYGPKCWAKINGIQPTHRGAKIPGQYSVFDFPEVSDAAKNNEKVCPGCGRKYTGHGCLSRMDNITMVCEVCGAMEALDAAREACGLKVGADEFETMKREIKRMIEGGRNAEEERDNESNEG